MLRNRRIEKVIDEKTKMSRGIVIISPALEERRKEEKYNMKRNAGETEIERDRRKRRGRRMGSGRECLRDTRATARGHY